MVWAFMVARRVGGDRVPPTWKSEEQDAGDASVPTPHPRPLPPLRMVMGFSSDDAYWAVTKVALRVYLRGRLGGG